MKQLYKSLLVLNIFFQGIKTPHEEFFWPAALLPNAATEDDDNLDAHKDERLERLQSGYNNYVGDEEAEEEDYDEEEEDTGQQIAYSVSLNS